MSAVLGAEAANGSPNCPKPLNDCLTQKAVPYKVSTDPSWHTYAATYNLRLTHTPRVIIFPETPQHISNAVVCARQHGIKVQARSGGHSYASFSTGGVDGAMVIDLENFQQVQVDDKGVAKVGGGIRLGPLSLAIYDQGNRGLAHGTCSAVGIGGHYTHGGYGHFSRAWGLAMDQIVALDVVLADGSFIHANSEENSDIYYAMRGAADSFGIVVNFYLQTQVAPDNVVRFDLNFSETITNVESAVRTFLHLQDMVHDASVVDRNLSFGICVSHGYFNLAGTYIGSVDEFNTTIAPAMKGSVPISMTKNTRIEALDWLKALKSLANDDLSVLHPYAMRSNFFAKSVTVPQPGFSEAAITNFFQEVFSKGSNPPTGLGWYTIFDLFGGADSQINTKDTDFAAYRGRDHTWVVQLQAFVDNNEVFPDEGLTFLEGLHDSLTKGLPVHGAYINYVDSSFGPDDARVKYYGPELYARLQEIKRQVDPDNVFSNPQSIKVG